MSARVDISKAANLLTITDTHKSVDSMGIGLQFHNAFASLPNFCVQTNMFFRVISILFKRFSDSYLVARLDRAQSGQLIIDGIQNFYLIRNIRQTC